MAANPTAINEAADTVARQVAALSYIRNILELVIQTLGREARDELIRTFVIDSCARLADGEAALDAARKQLDQYIRADNERRARETADRERTERFAAEQAEIERVRAQLEALLRQETERQNGPRQEAAQPVGTTVQPFRGDELLDQLRRDMAVLRDGTLAPNGLEILRRDLANLQAFLTPFLSTAAQAAQHDGRRDSAMPAQEASLEVHGPSAIESLVSEVIDMGHIAFDSREFTTADKCFKQALTLALQLPAQSKHNIDIFDLEYRVATLSPWVGDPQSAKQALSRFVHKTATNDEDVKDVAYAQHLLSQIHLQLGDLHEAWTCCDTALNTRLRLRAVPAQVDVSYALLARIHELQSNDILARAAWEKIPSNSREDLKKAYATLTTPDRPVQRIPSPNLPFRSQPVPVWNLVPEPTTEMVGPTPGGVQDAPSQSRNHLDEDTRRHLLRELDLRISPPAMQDALIRGDLTAVRTFLGPAAYSWRPLRSLHVAALFGEVEIAEELIQRNGSVNGLCTTTSASPGLLCHNVTPLHLAIAARHEPMVRLLVRHGAGLLPNHFVMGSSRASAPPLWLISERWITLTKCEDPQSIIDTLQVLMSLGLDLSAPLNANGQTMMDRARALPDVPYSWAEFKEPIISFLRQRARQRAIAN